MGAGSVDHVDQYWSPPEIGQPDGSALAVLEPVVGKFTADGGTANLQSGFLIELLRIGSGGQGEHIQRQKDGDQDRPCVQLSLLSPIAIGPAWRPRAAARAG